MALTIGFFMHSKSTSYDVLFVIQITFSLEIYFCTIVCASKQFLHLFRSN